MKTLRHSFVVLAIALSTSFSSAQLLKLSGHVTGTTGTAFSSIAVGESVHITLDLIPPLIDVAGGSLEAGGAALYSRPAPIIQIGPGILHIPNGPVFVSFFREPWNEFGAPLGLQFGGPVDVSGPWGPNNTGLPFRDLPFTPGDVTSGQYSQRMVSDHDILPSFSEFPSHLAIDEFTDTHGFYAVNLRSNPPFTPEQRVSWVITDYEFGPTNFVPVPESSAFALMAAGGLVALIVRRRRRTDVEV